MSKYFLKNKILNKISVTRNLPGFCLVNLKDIKENLKPDILNHCLHFFANLFLIINSNFAPLFSRQKKVFFDFLHKSFLACTCQTLHIKAYKIDNDGIKKGSR